MRPKRKRREQRKNQQEKNLFKLLGSIVLVVCISMILVGCAGHEKGNTYRVMLGRIRSEK